MGNLNTKFRQQPSSAAAVPYRIPDKVDRDEEVVVLERPLTTQKVDVPELMEIEQTGMWSWPTTRPVENHPTIPVLATSTPKNTLASSTRFKLNSNSFHAVSPLLSSSQLTQNAKRPVETIDLTLDEKPSTSVIEWPLSPHSKTTQKIDELGTKIRTVLDKNFGPRSYECDMEVDEIAVIQSPKVRKLEEDDDDIQILSESLVKNTTVNSLALELNNLPYTQTSWLNNRKTSFAEYKREVAAHIQKEETTLNILRNESTIERDLDNKIRRHLTITDIIELEPRKLKLPEITEKMQQIIDQAKMGYNQSEVLLTTAANIQITRADIRSLAPSKWLNDNVINSYLDLIALRSKDSSHKFPSVYVFTTFFYTKYQNEGYSNILKRWTRKVDIFSYDLLIFPIHLGVHWCLATADIRQKTLKYYDSLGGRNYTCPRLLLQYLSKEHNERKKCPINEHEWRTEIVEDIPQQENGSDCGMFACKFAEYLSRDSELSIQQQNMNYYRERMVYEIIKQDLLYP